MSEHTRDPSVDPPPDGRAPAGWVPEQNRWRHDTLRRATCHGVKLFNDGAYHAAHDCFEDEWYNYGNGTTESAFAHGMVQVSAGAYKYHERDNVGGMRSLFETATQYLRGTPVDFYGVDVLAVRTALENARTDSSVLDGWYLTLDGREPMATEVDYAYAAGLD